MPEAMPARPDTIEHGWAVDELGVEARDKAAAAAHHLGLSLPEYLSQLMLALALEERGAPVEDDASSAAAALLPTGAHDREIEERLEARFARLEHHVDRADSAAQRASEAETSLRQSLAEQVESIAHDVESRIEAALAALRAAADLAAGRADAATAALAEDLRAWRTVVDAQLAETTGAAQFASAETQARIDDLATIVNDNDLAIRAAVRDLAARTADAHEVRVLRERLDETNAEVAAMDPGVSLPSLDARIADLAHTLSAAVEQTSQEVRLLAAETERVEACTLASLVKLAADIADIRVRQDAAPPAPTDFDQRLTRLEAAAETVVSAHAVEAIRLQIAELRAHIVQRDGDDGLARRVDEVSARLAATEAANAAAFKRLHDTIDALEPNRQVTVTTGERLRAVEIAVSRLADRVEQSPAETAPQDALIAAETRIAEIEIAQAAALEAIHAQLALFIDAVNRRMDALEASDAAAHLGHMASAFDAFREQVDDRIGYIENHSVRALQHVAETVGVLEERFGTHARKSASG